MANMYKDKCPFKGCKVGWIASSVQVLKEQKKQHMLKCPRKP